MGAESGRGSRGLGHQVATDALVQMEKQTGDDAVPTNDRQARPRTSTLRTLRCVRCL